MCCMTKADHDGAPRCKVGILCQPSDSVGFPQEGFASSLYADAQGHVFVKVLLVLHASERVSSDERHVVVGLQLLARRKVNVVLSLLCPRILRQIWRIDFSTRVCPPKSILVKRRRRGSER